MKRFPACTISRVPQRSDAWFEIRRGVLTASQMGPWIAEQKQVRLTIDEIKDELCRLGIELPKSKLRSDILAALPNHDAYATYTVGGQGARKTAIKRCLAGISGCPEPPDFESWEMARGRELEPDAIEQFHDATGLEVEIVGFCLHESKAAGCSPDGLIVGQNVGLESKAPLPETHIGYLLDYECRDCKSHNVNIDDRRCTEGIRCRNCGSQNCRQALPSEYREQVHGSMAVTGADAWWFQSYCPNLPTLRLLVERDEYTEQMLHGIQCFAVELEAARLRVKAMWDEEFKQAKA